MSASRFQEKWNRIGEGALINHSLEAAMSTQYPLVIDRMDWQKFMPGPPVLTSYQWGWSNLLLEHYRQPLIDLPEVTNLQHVLIIPLGHQAVDFEFVAEVLDYGFANQSHFARCFRQCTGMNPNQFRKS